MTRILVAFLALGVVACQPLVRNGEESNYFIPAQGATAQLNRPLPVPVREVRSYIQFGEATPRRQVNPHYPNCHLELWTLVERPREVVPRTFVIERIERRHATLASGGQQLQVAALAMRPGDGSPTINFQTRFHLRAEEGSDVRRLNCSVWGEPGNGDYLELGEIRGALGDIVTLQMGW